MRNVPISDRTGERHPTEFGRHLLQEIAAAGYRSAAAFARAADVSGATINRVVYGDTGRPDADTLAKFADALIPKTPTEGRNERVATKRGELLWAAGYRIGDTPAAARFDPLVLELNQMLDPSSPLGTAERDALRMVVDRVMQPSREAMGKRRRRRTG